MTNFPEIENIEVALILEAMYTRYGHDFRDYSRVHVKRRIINHQKKKGIRDLGEFQHRLLTDEEFFHDVLVDLSLNVTEMFRDPHFFLAVREQVIPYLQTYPFLKIWHAGCATGEEVYSMAILLKEESMLDKSLLYATDFNQIVLDIAREGIYPADRMKLFSANYQKAGGNESLSDYLMVKYDSALIHKELRRNIVFSDHNLVTDGIFGEMNMIVCRNVLIYFNRELQNKVIRLFYNSLLPGGILCLGTKETLMFSEYTDKFQQLHKLNIFKKLYD